MVVLNGALGALLVIRNNQRLAQMRRESNRSRDSHKSGAEQSPYQSRRNDEQLQERRFKEEQRVTATLGRVDELIDSLDKKNPELSRQAVIADISNLVATLKKATRSDYEAIAQKLQEEFDSLDQKETEASNRLSMKESLGISISHLQYGRGGDAGRSWTGWNELLSKSNNPEALRAACCSLGNLNDDVRLKSDSLGSFIKAFENNRDSAEAIKALTQGLGQARFSKEDMSAHREQLAEFAQEAIRTGNHTSNLNSWIRAESLQDRMVNPAVSSLDRLAEQIATNSISSYQRTNANDIRNNLKVLEYLETAIDSKEAEVSLPALRAVQQKFLALCKNEGQIDRYEMRDVRDASNRLTNVVDYIDMKHNGMSAIDDWTRTVLPDLDAGLSRYFHNRSNHQVDRDPFSSHSQGVLAYIEKHTDSPQAKSAAGDLATIRDGLARTLVTAAEDSRFNTDEYRKLHTRITSICDAIEGVDSDDTRSPLEEYLARATTEELLRMCSHREVRDQASEVSVSFNRELSSRFDNLVDSVHPKSFREVRKHDIDSKLEAQKPGHYQDPPFLARMTERIESTIMALTPDFLLKRSFRKEYNPETAGYEKAFEAMNELNMVSGWQK